MFKLMFALPGGWELIIIIFVILLMFGGKKIPELARGIGKGIKEFNAAKSTIKKEIEDGVRRDDDSDETQKQAN